MVNSVILKANTRDAIVEIVHQIANGIDESFLFRDGVPIVVLVGGDPNTGKKIMPDETIEFFKKHYQFSKGAGAQEIVSEGKHNYDEFHGLQPQGQEALGVSFVNVLWDEDYSDFLENDEFLDALDGLTNGEARLAIGKRLVEVHATGDVIPNNGIVFIHNLEQQDLTHALKITFKGKGTPEGEGKDASSLSSRWDQTISIEVDPDSELGKSPRFQAALTQLQHNFG